MTLRPPPHHHKCSLFHHVQFHRILLSLLSSKPKQRRGRRVHFGSCDSNSLPDQKCIKFHWEAFSVKLFLHSYGYDLSASSCTFRWNTEQPAVKPLRSAKASFPGPNFWFLAPDVGNTRGMSTIHDAHFNALVLHLDVSDASKEQWERLMVHGLSIPWVSSIASAVDFADKSSLVSCFPLHLFLFPRQPRCNRRPLPLHLPPPPTCSPHRDPSSPAATFPAGSRCCRHRGRSCPWVEDSQTRQPPITV